MPNNRPTIGQLLRQLRSENEWTLKQMSEKSGIPLSTLSKVEHDRLTLTYDKLLQLSDRLEMPLSELFASSTDGNEAAVTARRSVGRVKDAIQVKTENYDYHYLCSDLRRKRMMPILTHIRTKSLEDFGDLIRHSGEEFLFVLEGRVTVHTEFYSPVTIEKGESIYIDSNMGHAFLAGEGCEEAVTIAVCSSPDKNVMDSFIKSPGVEKAERASER